MTIDGAAEASRAASAGRAPVDPLYTGRRFTLGTLLLIGRNQGLASNVSQAWQAVLPTESFEPMTGLETPPHIPNDFRTLLSGMGVLHPTVIRPLSFRLARRLNVTSSTHSRQLGAVVEKEKPGIAGLFDASQRFYCAGASRKAIAASPGRVSAKML